MSSGSNELRAEETVYNHAASHTRRSVGACNKCRQKKRRCDREYPCKQCWSRYEGHECSYAEAQGQFAAKWCVESVAPNPPLPNVLGNSAAEAAALRQTVAELQDRVWRTEVQLAAAGVSGQSTGVGEGEGKSSDRVESALQEMVALVTGKYTSLEAENRRLSQQVEEMRQEMRVQGHILARAPVLQNGHSGYLESQNHHNGTHIQLGERMHPHRPPEQPFQSNKRPHETEDSAKPSKRNCVSVACVPCKVKKIKCDGVRSGCAACSIHKTECVYDLTLDQRRKEAVPAERRMTIDWEGE